jgi:carbonic anhydrase/acetyltransferase-like protein (isoleucine patch superfamily)
VGAVFLGFAASVVVSLIYSGIILATYKDQSLTVANTLYLGHALLNGAVVGCLVGLVARRSAGARIGAAVIAALGAFFGYTNSLPLIIVKEQTPSFVLGMLRHDPFWPAKAWWTSDAHGGVDWYSPLGLVIAAAAAWGLAYAIGTRRRHG